MLEGIGPQQKKKAPTSPLLDRVLNGNSSVCLRVLEQYDKANPRLFATEGLNRTIIFKYPNFSVQPNAAAPETGTAEGAPSRPIETALFVPYDPASPQQGGHGIYLRQRSFAELMQRHLGLDIAAMKGESSRDLKILEEIDRIPSLDPFLLKGAVQRIHPQVDERYFAITPSEAEATRALIAAKVQPIIEKALDSVPADDRVRATGRFLAALWDPSLPEAELFISAFGIDRSGAFAIFEALKGVSFYQWHINSQRTELARLVKWLQSADSVPHDMVRFPHLRQNVDMFRAQILKSIREISRMVTEVFRDFEIAHQTFLTDGNPGPFRAFLSKAATRYWVLGYASTALSQSAHLYASAMRRSYKNRLGIEQFNELLTLINMAMASQSPGL